jgi:hypothetical protein
MKNEELKYFHRRFVLLNVLHIVQNKVVDTNT